MFCTLLLLCNTHTHTRTHTHTHSLSLFSPPFLSFHSAARDCRVPLTTRAARANEVDGKHYHFVTEAEFTELRDAGKLAEHGSLNGVFYGSLAPPTNTTMRGALDKLDYRVPLTTRSARASEVDGKHYHFVSDADFKSLVEAGKLAEYGTNATTGVSYGSLTPPPNTSTKKLTRTTSHAAVVLDPRVPITTRAPRTGEVPGKHYHFVSEETFAGFVRSGQLKEHGSLNGVSYGSLHPAPVGVSGAGGRDVRVPVTTRAPRSNEKDGKHYHFVSEAEFDTMLSSGHLAATGSTRGARYGTLKTSTTAAAAQLDARVPLTTRAPRDGEKNGVEYHFVSELDFQAYVAAGLLFEYGRAPSSGIWYGSLRSEVGLDRSMTRSDTYVGGLSGVRDFADAAKLTTTFPAIQEGGVESITVGGSSATAGVITTTFSSTPATTAKSAGLEWDGGFFSESLSGTVSASGRPVDAAAGADAKQKPTRLNVWSGPRCMSTALMYSFAQRADTKVLDEPLYAHHLVQRPELERPYRADLLASQENDGSKVIDSQILGHSGSPVLYAKHMGKQFVNLPTAWLHECHNVFLVRSPVAMLASYAKRLKPDFEELCWPQLMTLFSYCRANDLKYSVVDADLLAANPRAVLTQLCQDAGIAFDEAMLSWPAGPKEYDGCWADFWYKDGVHKSTGFAKPSSMKPVAEDHHTLVEDCFPIYAAISREAINSGARGVERAAALSLKNSNVFAWVDRGLVPRSQANLNVFEASANSTSAAEVVVRVTKGQISGLDEALAALTACCASAPDQDDIQSAVFNTLAANDMRDCAVVRVRVTQLGRLIVLAEWVEKPKNQKKAQASTKVPVW